MKTVKMSEMPTHTALYALWSINGSEAIKLIKEGDSTVIVPLVPLEKLNCPEGWIINENCFTNEAKTISINIKQS